MKSSQTGDLHISQFNALFDCGVLQNAIVNTTPFEIAGIKLSFTGLEVHRPLIINKGKTPAMVTDRRLLPKDCRQQGLTYGGTIFLKMKLEYKGRILFHDYKEAGILPIMVRSNMCNLSDYDNLYEAGEDPNEPGGYFIVSGHEKVVRFHIAAKRNFLFATKKKSKDTTYTEYSVMIRSVAEDELGQKNEIKYCVDGNIHFKTFLNRRIYVIPIVLLMRALVNCTDEEIFESLGCDQRVLTVLAKMKEYECYSQKECIEYLGMRFKAILKIEDKYECGMEFIRRTVLPHLEKLEDKFNLMVEAVKKLYRCYDGKIQPDDIDSPSNFELYTELQLISLCFKEKLSEMKRTMFYKTLYFIRNKVSVTESTTSINTSEAELLNEDFSELQLDKVRKMLDSLDINIGAKVHKFLSTGNITTVTCSDLLQNSSFSILADRINFWRFTSHLESVSRGAYFATLKVTTIRKLRPESWGFFCPLNTPDGAPCGLLFHLSKACRVSDRPMMFDSDLLYEYGVIPGLSSAKTGSIIPVFYNGKYMGTTDDSFGLVKHLRNHRVSNDLCYELCHEYGTGIDEAVYIFDMPSALYRRVHNIAAGKDEWIGMKEQVFLNIKLSEYKTKDAFSEHDRLSMGSLQNALEQGFEYSEIDNQNIFSSIAACVPFTDYNPSPRSIYQCQMAKQAMGIPAYNPQFRTDIKSFYINYLQSPMVKTGGYSTFEKFPIGFNCIVAVISYTAYDMEDAVVINKSAVDRGLFGSSIYKNEKFELDKNSFIDYTPAKGTRIETGDTLVRYTHPDNGTKVMKYQGSETGYVDTVRIYCNESTCASIKTPCVSIMLRIPRNPNIGDKFCSRHGQKGVCSILWPEVDMPFTEYGLRPDIIINPHAFPSRMTIGMLLESMCGKVAMEMGETQDATPFVKKTYFEDNSEDDQNNVGEKLRKCGFNYYGNEPMYSGITGTELRTDIFIGSVYYQRLRHMVNDKYQVRTSGAVVATTHQPVGGRKNKGGIRFGEMEKDALIAHGVSFTLKDRLMNCSDRTQFVYCGDCKNILFTGKNYCKCGSKSLKNVVLPYVFKYLCCELLSMNIKLSFEV